VASSAAAIRTIGLSKFYGNTVLSLIESGHHARAAFVRQDVLE
jgi:hypothetical protein